MKEIKKLFAISALAAIGGCSTVQPAISGFVAGYCANTPEQRKVIRDAVNASIVPNKLEIKCVKVKDE